VRERVQAEPGGATVAEHGLAAPGDIDAQRYRIYLALFEELAHKRSY
jgi:hypothetical protein